MDYEKLKELKEFGNEEIKSVLDKVIIVFDTSEFINLYSYKVDSALDILRLFNSKFKNQLYLPAHVKYEFENLRENKRRTPLSSYDDILKQINGMSNNKSSINHLIEGIDKLHENCRNTAKQIKNNFKEFYDKYKNQDKYPAVSLKTLNKIEQEVNKYSDYINGSQGNIINDRIKKVLKDEVDKKKRELNLQMNTETDKVFEKINKYFILGKDYSFKQKLEISYEGAKRYELSIPPGYLDENKKNTSNKSDSFKAYGDLFIWKQIIEISKNLKKPCILISDDTKSDWNDHNSERKRQPRAELLEEFYEETGNMFWKFTLKDFIGKFLEKDLNPKILSEIRKEEIKEIIEDDLEEFESKCWNDLIDLINSETDDLPLDAYDWEVEDDSIVPRSLSIKTIEEIDQDTFNIEYQGLCQVYKDVLCYEYLAKDDDTKEILTSPASNLIYKGEVLYRIDRLITIEDGSIIDDQHEINIDTSKLKTELIPWEDNEYMI